MTSCICLTSTYSQINPPQSQTDNGVDVVELGREVPVALPQHLSAGRRLLRNDSRPSSKILPVDPPRISNPSEICDLQIDPVAIVMHAKEFHSASTSDDRPRGQLAAQRERSVKIKLKIKKIYFEH